MTNYVVLVGRIKEFKENEKGTSIVLAVTRTFKNANGEYEIDCVEISLPGTIGENTKEYCKPNDIIGIKGRIQKLESDNELIIVAGKVTFLSSSRKEDEE